METMKIPMPSSRPTPCCTNLVEHFKKNEDKAEVVATRNVQELTGEVTLCNSSDLKKYLPLWVSKRDSYRNYSSACGYKVSYNNQGEPSLFWVGEVYKPSDKGLVSYKLFLNYWKQNHGNIVVNMSS